MSLYRDSSWEVTKIPKDTSEFLKIIRVCILYNLYFLNYIKYYFFRAITFFAASTIFTASKPYLVNN